MFLLVFMYRSNAKETLGKEFTKLSFSTNGNHDLEVRLFWLKMSCRVQNGIEIMVQMKQLPHKIYLHYQHVGFTYFLWTSLVICANFRGFKFIGLRFRDWFELTYENDRYFACSFTRISSFFQGISKPTLMTLGIQQLDI